MDQLTDQFGRVHDYLRISLTERCNLRCTYCMPAEGIPLRDRSCFMTKDEVLELSRVFTGLGIKKIRLTGGEPLVRKDAGEIISELGKLPVELAITTNGILIDQYIADLQKANVRSVNVSLDSLDEKKFSAITRRNYFGKAVRNIELLIKKGFHVKINAVVIQDLNADEIIDFIEWTRLQAVHIRFIEYMPFNGNQWQWNKCVSYKKMMQAVYRVYSNKVFKLDDQENDTARNYQIKDYKGTFAFIASVTNPFCTTCNRIRLTADGKLKNCLFSGTEIDLLTPLRKGENILPLIYSEVWKKEASRGGMNTFQKFSDPGYHNNNRSMVTIGG